MYQNSTLSVEQRQRNIERIKHKVERTFFEVNKVEVLDPEKGRMFQLQDQYGRSIAKVSDRYTLVRNRDIIQPLIDKFGWENVNRVESTGNSFLYEIGTGRSIDIDGNGDLVDEKLVAWNSYNKTKAYNFALGAFRGYCSNGCYFGMAFFNYKKIHIGEIPVKSLVENVLNTYQQNDFGLWKRMAKAPLAEESITQAVNEFNAFEVKEENALAGNAELNKDIRRNTLYFLNQNGKVFPRNVWGLYNAFNSSIAHTFRWKRSQFSKVILANKNAEAYLAQRYELN